MDLIKLIVLAILLAVVGYSFGATVANAEGCKNSTKHDRFYEVEKAKKQVKQILKYLKTDKKKQKPILIKH